MFVIIRTWTRLVASASEAKCLFVVCPPPQKGPTQQSLTLVSGMCHPSPRESYFVGCGGHPSHCPLPTGMGEIHMNEVQCLGSEKSLWSCPHKNITREDCKHSEDASVRCNIPYMGYDTTVSLCVSSPSLLWGGWAGGQGGCSVGIALPPCLKVAFGPVFGRPRSSSQSLQSVGLTQASCVPGPCSPPPWVCCDPSPCCQLTKRHWKPQIQIFCLLASSQAKGKVGRGLFSQGHPVIKSCGDGMSPRAMSSHPSCPLMG